jgi:hypothetical protein
VRAFAPAYSRFILNNQMKETGMYHRDYGVRAEAARLRSKYENEAAEADATPPTKTVGAERAAGSSLVTRMGAALGCRCGRAVACQASGGRSR